MLVHRMTKVKKVVIGNSLLVLPQLDSNWRYFLQLSKFVTRQTCHIFESWRFFVWPIDLYIYLTQAFVLGHKQYKLWLAKSKEERNFLPLTRLELATIAVYYFEQIFL